jgi:hypothetical protein
VGRDGRRKADPAWKWWHGKAGQDGCGWWQQVIGYVDLAKDLSACPLTHSESKAPEVLFHRSLSGPLPPVSLRPRLLHLEPLCPSSFSGSVLSKHTNLLPLRPWHLTSCVRNTSPYCL